MSARLRAPHCCTLGLALFLASASQAHADVLGALDAARLHGCPRGAGHLANFRETAALDGAARALAAGTPLREATRRMDYPTLGSASLHVTGAASDAALTQLLIARFCATLTDPTLREAGVYRQGAQLWIVLAAPFATPALADPTRVGERVLQLVNDARAQPRHCGSQAFAAAKPLRWSAHLYAAALEHSRDMAERSYFAHEGSDASSPASRVTRAGYPWSTVGENIAEGAMSATEVTAGWLLSPEHCANIMDPDFTEMAVAYRVNSRSPAGVYWTQELARPRPSPHERRAAERQRERLEPQPQRAGSAPGTNAS